MIDLDNILSLKTILPILGLMLAPILSKTIRSLPSTIIKVLGKHFVTVITFEELNKHAAVERRRIVGTLRLLTWLDEKHPKSAHRRRNLTMRWGKKRLSPMNDIVLWFMYKGMPVRYTSTQMKGEAELDLYVHELLFLSRNDQRVNEFLDEACPDDEFESSVVYDYTTGSRGGMWSHTGHYNKNVKVFLKEELVEKLTSAITHFRDNSEWYVRNGLARKLTILLQR